MKKYIEVNGNKYEAIVPDYNFVCDLDEMGIPFSKVTSMSGVRAYIAVCMGVDKETAGAEIQEHIINGGKLDNITAVMVEQFEDAAFFRAISKSEEETDSEGATEEKKTSRIKK